MRVMELLSLFLVNANVARRDVLSPFWRQLPVAQIEEAPQEACRKASPDVY